MRFLHLFLSLIAVSGFAQDGHYQFGGRNAGMAGTSVTLADSWSLLNNPGAIGRVEKTAAFAGYQNRYNVADFQSVAGGFVHSTKWAATGIGYYRFGGADYNQQRVSVGIGNKIQFVSLGAGASIIQYHLEGLKTIRRAIFEFGGTAEIIPKLVLGAHMFNFRQNRTVPTIMKAGLSYRPSGKLTLNSEIEKELETREVFRTGMEYFPISNLAFRTGFSSKPFRSAFGIGFQWSSFQLDYAFTSSQILGPVHDVSLVYLLGK